MRLSAGAAVLIRGAVAIARAHRGVERGLGAWKSAIWGALAEALSPEEQTALGIELYDGSPQFRSLAAPAWEAEWLARELPPAPAKILVGACGGGREMLHLLERGYVVVGFDPAPSMTRLAAERAGGRARVLTASYDDLVRAVLDGAGGPLCALAGERFDAVLLGLGSLSHVLRARDRARLLEACARLASTGPILATFTDLPPESHRPGRAERFGRTLGRALGRMRGVRATAEPATMFGDLAFAALIGRGEVAALAKEIGREAKIGALPYEGACHVVFVARP